MFISNVVHLPDWSLAFTQARPRVRLPDSRERETVLVRFHPAGLQPGLRDHPGSGPGMPEELAPTPPADTTTTQEGLAGLFPTLQQVCRKRPGGLSTRASSGCSEGM